MKVLVCGARGFVGRQIVAQLKRAGVTVVEAVSSRGSSANAERMVIIDFKRAVALRDWLPHLAGVNAVVNAVGVLRDSRRCPMSAVHDAAPRALFDACAAAGVRRVVQISALGIANGDTRYASSKRAADAHLLQLTEQGRLDGVVLRPSVIFGAGGASSALFLQLARLPALLLPAPVIEARVQPLRVGELAEVVAALLTRESVDTGLIECTGPRALCLGEFVASLRAQLGQRPARSFRLPSWLTRLSVVAGDAVPITPWGSQALALLAQDNVADGAAFAALLGRTPTDPQDFLAAA